MRRLYHNISSTLRELLSEHYLGHHDTTTLFEGLTSNRDKSVDLGR
jgi:hypothetical protein